MSNLHQKASLSTTAFGVGRREMIIGGLALVDLLAFLAIPFAHIFLRVVLGVITSGALAFWAVYRVDAHNRPRYWTLEAWLLNKFRYGKRVHKYQYGGARGSQVRYGNVPSNDEADGEGIRQSVDDAWFYLPGFTNEQAFVTIASMATLTIMLAWIGTGGVEQAQYSIMGILGR